MKASAKRPKTAVPQKKRVARTNNWITSGTSAGPVVSDRIRSKWVVLGILLIALVLWLGPLTASTWEGVYYNFFPTPEMRQLQVIKKSLGLPKAAYESDDDLGCHTTYFFFSKDTSRCERSISLDFSSSNFVKPLRQRLTNNGWRQRPYDSYGIKASDITFDYYKQISGKKFCVEGLVDHSSLNAGLPTALWLYAGSDDSCASV